MLGMLSHNEYDRVVNKVAGRTLESRPFAASRTGLSLVDHVSRANKALEGVVCVSVSYQAENPKEGAMALSAACLKAVSANINPKSVSISLQAPVKMKETAIKAYIKEACDQANATKLSVSEINVSRFNVEKLMLTVAVTGEKFKREVNKEAENLYLILAGKIGNEGAILLADKEHDKLREYYSDYYLRTNELYKDITDIKPMLTVAKKAAFCEPVLEGGIFRSLWALAERLHLGFDVQLKAINAYQLTIEICERLDITPYILRSGGAVLLVTDNHEAASAMCAEAGISSSVIGVFNKTTGRHILNEDTERILERPAEDSYFTYYQGEK